MQSPRHNLLRGHEAAVKCWAAAGPDIVVGGHIHLPFVLPLRERWPDLKRDRWTVQAGTAVSNRVRADAGNSVNVIRVGASMATADADAHAAPRRCLVERWDHAAATHCFERVSAHALAGAHVG